MQQEGRGRIFPAIIGLAVGIIVTGLVLPFAVSESGSPSTAVGSLSTGPGSSGAPDTTGTGSDDLATGDPSEGGSDLTSPGGGSSGATGSGADAAGGPGGVAGDTAAPAGRPAPQSAGASGPAGAALTASDRGVTESTIRLGVATADLRTANAIGLAPDGYSIEEQERAYRVFIDDINARGGIHGRQIEVFFATVDPFNGDSARAACLSLVQDKQVFTVISLNSLATPGSLCVTREGETPLISGTAMPTEIFRQAGGRLITNMANIERMMANWVAELDRSGLLRGRTIGVLASEDDEAADKQAADAVVAELERAGHQVAYRSRLSADLQTGTGQIPVEVQQMRQAGVDFILLPVNFLYATQFVQAADGQGYRPRYAVSDHQGLYSDELVANMPASFEGAVSFTSYRVNEKRAGLPEPRAERECRERHNRRADPDYQYGDNVPAIRACGQVSVFEAAANAAGPELTRPGFLQGLAGIGRFPLTQVVGGSFGPGKTDFADDIRPMTWSAGCRCWEIAGEPRRGKH